MNRHDLMMSPLLLSERWRARKLRVRISRTALPAADKVYLRRLFVQYSQVHWNRPGSSDGCLLELQLIFNAWASRISCSP